MRKLSAQLFSVSALSAVRRVASETRSRQADADTSSRSRRNIPVAGGAALPGALHLLEEPENVLKISFQRQWARVGYAAQR